MLEKIMARLSSVKRRHMTIAAGFLVVPILFTVSLPVLPIFQRAQTSTERGVEALRQLTRNAGGQPSPAELSRIESQYPNTRAAALARFLRGYQAYKKQDHAAAIDALDARTISAYSALGDYALYFRGEARAALNAHGEAMRDYATVYEKHADSLYAREARLRAIEMAIKVGDATTARQGLASLIEAEDADALYLQSQLYEATGRADEAASLYRRIYFTKPATRAAAQAETRLTSLNLAPKTNPGSVDEVRSRANGLYEARLFAEAAQVYDELATRFPEAAADDEMRLRRGISLLNAKRPADAAAVLGAINSRDASVQAEALFHYAEALQRSNRTAQAATVVERLLSQHGRAPQAEEALYNLATAYKKAGQTTAASARYRQLIAQYPKSRYAAEASYYLGWQAYLSNNLAEASRILQQHLKTHRYPESKFLGEAGFWAGKAEERLGNRARALALYDMVAERYRYGYHGFLAERRARTLRAANASLKAEAIKPGSDLETMRRNILHVEPVRETADGTEAPRLARADDLEVIGLSDLAVRELNAAIDKAPTSPRLNLRLAKLYSARGDKFQATLILRRAYPDIFSYADGDLPREAWEVFFPLSNWETIKQEARRYGIDPHVAAGLIRQESVFNPEATSRVGARGLMQLMPDTGRLVARRQGAGNITANDLYNPDLNIKLGMNYLSQMLGQFGRIEYAAAAYNAGPGRVKRWIAERGSMDIEEWVETIPFTETRGYVQGVIRFSVNYRRFYPN